MTKDLTVFKLSTLASSLTGKEVALLVIDYYLREEKEGKDYTDEVKTIASTITYSNPSRKAEYVFYYEMWRNCGFFSLDLQTCLLNLEINTWKLETIKQLILESCSKLLFSRFVNMLPKYLTIEQYDDLYKRCKISILAEQLPLETAAEFEAFSRLKKEGLIPDNASYGIDDVFGDNKDLIDTFEKYISKTLRVLEEDLTKGLLEEVKVKDKIGWYHSGEEYIGQRGITGESWYKYDKKLDRGYNEIVDSKEQLIESYEGEMAVVSGTAARMFNEGGKICWAEKNRQDLASGIQKGMSLSLQDGVVVLDPTVESSLEKLVEWVNAGIQKSTNHQEVLKRIQTNIFNNKIELGGVSVGRAADIINNPKEVMDQLIEQALHSFELFVTATKPKLKNVDKLKIKVDPSPDEDFVNKQIKMLTDLAERESGYRRPM